MGNATQAELAKLFGRSQPWISKRQGRATDPMPRDLAGAIEWGRRNGLLAGAPEGILPLDDPQPPEKTGALTTTPPLETAPRASGAAVTPAPAALERQDLKLKEARTKKLELEIELQAGRLMHLEDVEARESANAAEFRLAACEYPLRARAVIERHITDAAIVQAIMRDLQPLAAELLNRADPGQVLRKKTKDEVRAILQAHLEEIIACLP